MKMPMVNLVLPRWMRRWEEFWFTPADPTVLALIRMACGSILVYTLIAYSFDLQDLMGKHAWSDLKWRLDSVHKQIWPEVPLTEIGPVLNSRRAEDIEYVQRYFSRWHKMPPGYVKSKEEEEEIDAFIEKNKVDPRTVYDYGMRVFSLWFHVTDPAAMAVIHGLIIATAIAFTLGLGTRLTAPLIWFGTIGYAERAPNLVFGTDQVTLVMLTYLMISPCGAAYSVDRLVQRWWRQSDPGVLAWLHRLLRGSAVEAPHRNGAPLPDAPQPSISANFAIRLLQIHVCVIYLAAGLSKLLGNSWWTGNAVWYTLACWEFAPMQNSFYMDFLRYLARNPLAYALIVTCGGYFTLTFEITYAFLVWRPSLRWFYLGSAILLHGLIGFFMGLITFSWIMLVMNMAFLHKEEAAWILGWLDRFATAKPPAPAPQRV